MPTNQKSIDHVKIQESVTSTVPETSKSYRYPGPESFRDDVTDSRIFFGREIEVEEVLNRLLSNKLLVLYAKSGLGKTSLLQAGLFPKLREKDMLPIRLRFNHRDSTTLIAELQNAVSKACKEQDVAHTAGIGESYWEYFNTALFSKGDQFLTPVLILDQFEEIFTLQQQKYRTELGKQLGNLVSGLAPELVRERIRASGKSESNSDIPNVRLLISLREDYLGALQELTVFIPGILSQRFRLTQLDRERAKNAILKPAILDIPEYFLAAPFLYQPGAVDGILAHLQEKSGIEPFQLQLLCRHVELQVIENQTKTDKPITVDLSGYFGGKNGMDAVINSFYQNAIAQIKGWLNRCKASKLCETGLLNSEGRRESLSKTQIKNQYRLSEPVLLQLVESKVLRREERLENQAFELSHDSLAKAVFKSRKKNLSFKWMLYTLPVILVISGLAFIQYQKAQNNDTRANNNLEEYKQQVKALVDLDYPKQPDKRTIKFPTMIAIPKGSYNRGSDNGSDDEKPVRKVTIPAFSIGAKEVTFEEYDQFAATTVGVKLSDDTGWGRGNRPVFNVSWDDANAYATWLSQKTGKKYRLPTEAEWEYAARAGTTGDYYWENDDPQKYAWFEKNSKGQTQPVGQKDPNKFGLRDMSGNVREWVQDCYAGDYKLAPVDGSAWEFKSCERRVLRGGSWSSKQGRLRSAYRGGYNPDARILSIGFRLAQD